MSEMAPERPMPRHEVTLWLLRRATVDRILREIAHRPDVGIDARRALLELANKVTATPGVDDTCRTCGGPLPIQDRGRPRVYCHTHSDMSKPSKGKTTGKTVIE